MVVGDQIRVLGPHLLLAPLADGGMGAVFLAADAVASSRPRQLCLVKTLKTGLASVSDYRPRFIDESRVAVLLRHEHLCQVFGGGESGGEFYLSMELIEGVTFKRLVSLLQQHQQKLTTAQAAALAVAMLRGLHAAHTAVSPDGRALGVVHRDVSPHNAMVDIHGGIKLIDFGLATSVLKETFTESAVVLGKSAYMAPEQARGEDVTPAVDQYAAAVVLYELLTDDRFYGDMQSRNIWSVVCSGTHVPRAWSAVPPAFAAILKRGLGRRAEDRFASCAEFANAIVDVEPAATSRVVARSLGVLVQSLRPTELDIIAAARARLADIEAHPTAALSSLDVTERNIAPSPNSLNSPNSPNSMGQTESVSRSLPTVVAGEADTGANAATPLALPARRVGGRTAAALGIVAVVLVMGGAVAATVMTRRASVPVVATPVALPVAVPVAAPSVVVASPVPVAPMEPPVTLPPAVDPDADNTARATKLFARIKSLDRCKKTCAQVLRTLTLAQIRRDPKGAGALVQDCKEQCSP
jgi:serine/threonine protein kinase